MTVAGRVLARFVTAATSDSDKESSRLGEEIETLQELNQELEELIFMEDWLRDLVTKVHRLSATYSDLREVKSHVDGIHSFMDRAIREALSASKEIDDCLETRTDRVAELDER